MKENDTQKRAKPPLGSQTIKRSSIKRADKSQSNGDPATNGLNPPSIIKKETIIRKKSPANKIIAKSQFDDNEAANP